MSERGRALDESRAAGGTDEDRGAGGIVEDRDAGGIDEDRDGGALDDERASRVAPTPVAVVTAPEVRGGGSEGVACGAGSLGGRLARGVTGRRSKRSTRSTTSTTGLGTRGGRGIGEAAGSEACPGVGVASRPSPGALVLPGGALDLRRAMSLDVSIGTSVPMDTERSFSAAISNPERGTTSTVWVSRGVDRTSSTRGVQGEEARSVRTTSSGGTPNRTGTMLFPTPLVTHKWRPSSM